MDKVLVGSILVLGTILLIESLDGCYTCTDVEKAQAETSKYFKEYNECLEEKVEDCSIEKLNYDSSVSHAYDVIRKQAK